MTANHRVNDAVFTEDTQQVLTGRFMYGPLDMVTLAGEKVIFVLPLQHHTLDTLSVTLVYFELKDCATLCRWTSTS